MAIYGDLKLEELDEIKIIEDGKVRGCFGLMFTLYFNQSLEKSKIKAVAECIEAYRDLAKDNLTWYLPVNGGQYSQFSSIPLSNLVQYVDKKYQDGDSFEVTLLGGRHYLEASSYNIATLFPQGLGERSLGFLTGSLPFSWLEGSGPGSFQKFIHHWCNKLSPFHGYAGLGLIQSFDYDQMRRDRPLVYPIARRFPGIDIENAITLSRFLCNGIKGVNWLTILGDVFLEKVGGQEALSTKLGPDFIFSPYPGGTVIQAGPAPEMGDQNRNWVPAHYRKLGNELKAIRASYPYAFLKSPAQFPDKEDERLITQQWFARFDN